MPKPALILAVVVCVAAALQAQDTTPVFRSGTTLIEFTFVALDGKGNPVTDLRQDEVVLTERGRPRDIAFFRFDGNAPAAPEAAPRLATGYVTNRPAPERNASAILFDFVNTDPLDQTCARSLTLKYLTAMPENSYAGLYRVAEDVPVKTLQPLTSDIAAVRAKIKSMDLAVRKEFSTSGIQGIGTINGVQGNIGTAGLRSDAAATEARALGAINAGIQRTRMDKTIAAFHELGNHLAGIPGRKSIVWVGNGFDMRATDESSNWAPTIRIAAEQLANQGVAVYPMWVPYNPNFPCSIVDVKDHPGVLDMVADVTGGRVSYNTSDYGDALARAAVDQRATYTVGFYANDDADDQWRSIAVKILRDGVNVHSRQGYLAVRRARVRDWTPQEWTRVSEQLVDATAIRLNAKPDTNGAQLTISLQLTAQDLYFASHNGQLGADLEIGLIELNGKEATNVRVQPMDVTFQSEAEQRAALVPLTTTWKLNPGTKSVRIVVRDRTTGKYGTLEMKVTR